MRSRPTARPPIPRGPFALSDVTLHSVWVIEDGDARPIARIRGGANAVWICKLMNDAWNMEQNIKANQAALSRPYEVIK